MKKTLIFPVFACLILLASSCKDSTEQGTGELMNIQEPPATDLTQLKSDIQALENAWADATNKKDINALMAMYTEDAMSMDDGGPTLVGKADIQKKQEADFGTSNFASIAFETLEVYGQGEYVTEIGTSKTMDAEGKTIGTGKYMVVFVKKDGKYLCFREIYNKDSK